MKRAKKGGRKGGLRIETQFTFNQFEVFEGSTKGVQRDIEESAKCKKAREEGGSKSREKGNSLRCFPAGGIFLMVSREFSRTGHVYYTYRGTSIIRNLVIPISDYLNIFVILERLIFKLAYLIFVLYYNTRSGNSFLLTRISYVIKIHI